MEAGTLTAHLAGGTINYLTRTDSASHLQWNPHPTFAGVYLKHLVKGADTGSLFSCHIVKIDPGCTLAEHIHAEQWELHEVIEGVGTAMLDTRELPYHPGQITVIPQGTKHQVIAGKQGLVLLAKFFPALI